MPFYILNYVSFQIYSDCFAYEIKKMVYCWEY
jgi:hypothetical protein